MKDKKNRLAPEIKKLRTLRTRYSEIEKVHNEKKKIYDQVSSTIDMERERIDKDIGSTFKEYKESESKFHQNNIQSEIYESFSSRINSEAKHVSNPEKRLSAEFKSYQEFFNAKLRQQENVMKDLRAHQRHIKDNSDNFGTQMQLFKDLRSLLDVKRKTVAEGGDGLVGYQDEQARGFDRFVVRD